MIPERLLAGQALGLRRALSHSLDPVELFRRSCAGGLARGSALLETAEAAGSGRGGRSLLVLRSALRLVCRGGEVRIEAQNDNGASLLPWLSERLAACVELFDEPVFDGLGSLRCTFPRLARGSEVERLAALSPLHAVRVLLDGLLVDREQPTAVPLVVGTLAYDLLDSYESLPPAASDPHDWPDYELWLADRAIWVDAERGRLTLVAQVFGGEHAQRCYLEGVADLTRLVDEVQACGQPPFSPADHAATVARAERVIEGERGEVAVDLDDAAYAALVSRLKQHIVAGDVFQIVPSRAFSLPCPAPLAAYRVLRALNPSPYMFFINGGDGLLFGASPETAIRIEGSPRTVTVRPIAGTRLRGRRPDGQLDADLDGRLEAELRLDEKEVAEHMMLVDLARNDVARVSRPGTRRVDKLLTVERYSHVMHLVSQVSGELRDDLDALHAYVATMNMGTLVGAPKIRAAQLLREHEATKRAAYGGAVGYFTADGRMDSAIVIRSALVQHGVATVRAGAGVVYDSCPAAEADESRRKAEAVLTAIRRAAREEGEGTAGPGVEHVARDDRGAP